jgi:putative SOS response-associated peptidase YedK
MPPAYRLDASAQQIARALRADPAGDVWQGGEVVPGGYAPVVITDHERGRHVVPRQWGVPPPPRGEHVVPFVRNLGSPFWIGTLRHTRFRCLVPMTHFRKGNGWLTCPTEPIIACAGIWRDSEIPSFAILTSGAAGALPVILQPADFGIWLHADIKIARRLVEGPAGTA